jgi:hypothetical protein
MGLPCEAQAGVAGAHVRDDPGGSVSTPAPAYGYQAFEQRSEAMFDPPWWNAARMLSEQAIEDVEAQRGFLDGAIGAMRAEGWPVSDMIAAYNSAEARQRDAALLAITGQERPVFAEGLYERARDEARRIIGMQDEAALAAAQLADMFGIDQAEIEAAKANLLQATRSPTATYSVELAGARPAGGYGWAPAVYGGEAATGPDWPDVNVKFREPPEIRSGVSTGDAPSKVRSVRKLRSKQRRYAAGQAKRARRFYTSRRSA